jgi:geranylgeranyl diphosphate synthase type II
MKEELKKFIEEKLELINNALRDNISRIKENSVLYAAISYSLFPGGKRLRPILLLTTYESINGKIDEKAIIPACSIELIHTYSLIHDDLPIMDNSDTRRGRATTHKVYGNDIALLAGDALLTHAFYLLSETFAEKNIDKDTQLKLINKLAYASGINGLVEGQAFEAFQKNGSTDENIILYIHEHKTAALFGASLALSGILTLSSEEIVNSLELAGKNFGIAYQIADDIKDYETSDSEINYVKAFGREKSIEKLNNYLEKAIATLKSLPFNADKIIDIFSLIRE